MNPASDRSGADWIAWVLQVAFGAFIGGLFGLGLIAQRRSGFWLSADVIAVYLWGGGVGRSGAVRAARRPAVVCGPRAGDSAGSADAQPGECRFGVGDSRGRRRLGGICACGAFWLDCPAMKGWIMRTYD